MLILNSQVISIIQVPMISTVIVCFLNYKQEATTHTTQTNISRRFAFPDFQTQSSSDSIFVDPIALAVEEVDRWELQS